MDILSLSPNATLDFAGPFTQQIKRTVPLTITNSTGNTLHYRIKTTAPKLYAARPGIGNIKKWESVVVYVTLHGLKEEPPLSFKCKDKFLIQAFTVTPDQEHYDVKELWEIAYKDGSDFHVYQRKLRVVYLPPTEARVEEGDPEEVPVIQVEAPKQDGSETSTVVPPSTEVQDGFRQDHSVGPELRILDDPSTDLPTAPTESLPEVMAHKSALLQSTVVPPPTEVQDGSRQDHSVGPEPRILDDPSADLPAAPAESLPEVAQVPPSVSQEVSVAHVDELGLAESRSSTDSDQKLDASTIVEQVEVQLKTESESILRKRSLDSSSDSGTKNFKGDDGVVQEETTITECVVSKEVVVPLSVPIHQRGIPVWIVCILVSTTFIFTYVFL